MIEYYTCRIEEDDRLKIEVIGDELILNFISSKIELELHFNSNDLDRMINQLTVLKGVIK